MIATVRITMARSNLSDAFLEDEFAFSCNSFLKESSARDPPDNTAVELITYPNESPPSTGARKHGSIRHFTLVAYYFSKYVI